MAVRKRKGSWGYDFTLPGYPRVRRAGFRTKAEALAAEQRAREIVVTGARRVRFVDAYERYLLDTRLSDRTRDQYARVWKREISPSLGHLYIEDVDTEAMDAFKRALPSHLGPKSINNRLALVGAVLRFMWKRGKLKELPYIPRESVPKRHQDWYTEAERDLLLNGMFELQPQWYLFFYITVRLGLRRGEIYAIEHRQVRVEPPRLIVDQAVQIGTKTRPALIKPRKNNEAYVLELSGDVLDAIEWHIEHGYGGPRFLFAEDDRLPVYLDGHVRALQYVQDKLGLRRLSHHRVGRHSVASQAATMGHSIKAIQSQLGHRSEQSTHQYAHLGSRAQLRLVQDLAPLSPPHQRPSSPPRGGPPSPGRPSPNPSSVIHLSAWRAKA